MTQITMHLHNQGMRRLLASDLLPRRAGQPVKALAHISFLDLCQMDTDSALQDKWIEEYRARWAAHRAGASVSTGDGGAWLEGDAARAIACDAMIIPVVTADLDPGAVEDLIAACVQYHRVRAQAAAGEYLGGDSGVGTSDGADPGVVLGMLERQIPATLRGLRSSSFAAGTSGLQRASLGRSDFRTGPGGRSPRRPL